MSPEVMTSLLLEYDESVDAAYLTVSAEREADALTWLSYAVGEVDAARSRAGRHVRPRIVAFHAQQAVEGC